MSIAKTLGSATGTSAAYTKHAVIATGIGGKGFISEYIAETKAAYIRKDAELLERREEMRAIAAASGAVPVMKRQNTLVVDV